MIIERDGKEFELTVSEIYEAYRKCRLIYRIEDAECHVADMDLSERVRNLFQPSDYKAIAERFINNHDCNLTENDQFECIIEDYVKEKWQISL